MVKRIQTLLDSSISFDNRLHKICQLLNEELTNYNWVGFYFHHPEKNELHLGPYVGEATDHTVIPFGKGICGQVAETNETFLVDDVHSQENYLVCSLSTQSEIVVPIFANGKNIGQIDIDSHSKNRFKQEDQKLLEEICQLIGKKIEVEKPQLV